ncbi:MAG TPA: hypothetical protein VGN09_13440 [Vicinamibacteria bacterium]|jgi:hypothetical protein
MSEIFSAPGEEQKTSLGAYRQVQQERREFEARAEQRRRRQERPAEPESEESS